MVRPYLLRIIVGSLISLSIILLIINEPDFDSAIPELPELPEPMTLFNLITRGFQNVSHPPCKCSLKQWPGIEFIPTILNLSVSWINTTTYHHLKQHHPNLPLQLLNGAENMRCSLLPTLFSIEWRNKHWQRATLDFKESFWVYSAFFDPETDGESSIRLLGVSKSTFPSLAWCHIWFNSHTPPLPIRVTNVDYLDYQRRNADRQMPYLLRCPVPSNITDIPVAVSLTSQPCTQATNLLKVVGGREREVSAYRNRKVPDNPTTLVKGWAAAVCGPALFYYHEDFSSRLVEWLELLRSQGFDQVFLYATDVHPNITKVLHHYTQEGFVQVTDYTYPPPYLNDPDLRKLWVLVERSKMFAQENVYFTDCVLRHMHQYRFLTHFDPDEMPILPNHNNFTHFLDELLASVTGEPPSGYRLQWSSFFSNLEPSEQAAALPANLWMLRHTARPNQHPRRLSSGTYKPIYDMNVVRGVFSHGSFLCLSGRCSARKMKAIPPDIGFLGHYKHTCDQECQSSTVHDLTLLKYKEQVGNKVQRVMKTLNLL